MSKKRYSSERPLGLTIIALIFFIYGLFVLIFLFSTMGMIIGILSILIGIGLLEGSELARIMVIILLVIALVLNSLERDILGILLDIIMLIYMTERKVRNYFGS